MITLGVVFLEMIVLFFLARAVNISIFSLLYVLTGSKRIAMYITTFLYLPGTVVHEFAHLIVAQILGVHTGRLNLIPEYANPKTNGDTFQAGSVEVAKSDPFRRMCIGLAPLLVGLVLSTLLAWQLGKLFPVVTNLISTPKPWTHMEFYVFFGLGYFLFTAANNMFPSSLDMVGVPPMILFLLISFLAAYYIGFRISINGQVLFVLQDIVLFLKNSILVVLGIDGTILAIFRSVLYVVMKKKRVRFVN
jgi:hypothetical protein